MNEEGPYSESEANVICFQGRMAGPPVPQLLHLVLDVVRDVDQDVGCPPRWRCHQPGLQNGLQEGQNLLLCSRWCA